MKATTVIAAPLAFSTPAVAEENKYAGTGMSVTGPAAEKKAPTPPLAPSRASAAVPTDKATQGGSTGTSAEETEGLNSAMSNSH
jgi:hypothetical protein